LGFEADAGIPVHRLEVWERLQHGENSHGPPTMPAAPIYVNPQSIRR
jgi:hypothetical protein